MSSAKLLKALFIKNTSPPLLLIINKDVTKEVIKYGFVREPLKT